VAIICVWLRFYGFLVGEDEDEMWRGPEEPSVIYFFSPFLLGGSGSGGVGSGPSSINDSPPHYLIA
jgi:hypothetical protein